MSGRLAIDFGTCNTRAAVWDEAEKKAKPLSIPDISYLSRYSLGVEQESPVEVAFVPSVIHYSGSQVWIGRQVREQGKLEASGGTFRWMKRYISNRLELPQRVGGSTITFSQAGADFLTRVLSYASSAIGLGEEEVAFTVPVEAYEHYQDWLTGVCEKAGIARYRLLDEASASALGYGVSIQANDVYMVFDFGGGTMNASVILVEGGYQDGGKRCRVLGKGGAEVGGTVIDQWLYQDVLARCNREPEDVRHISGLLLVEVERMKEALTSSDSADLTVADPQTGAVISVKYTRTMLEELLESRGMFTVLQGTIDQALAHARERGYEKDHIKAVLLSGGSSLIPCVRRTLRQLFGERVKYHRPLDAVALGGAAFVGGVDFYDHIQHDYALREYDRTVGDYVYRVLVKAGTSYPSKGEICKLTVKAAVDEADFLGLSVYEMGYQGRAVKTGEAALELTWDESGAARLVQTEEETSASNFYQFVRKNKQGTQTTFFSETKPPQNPDRGAAMPVHVSSVFWVNEKCPTFIQANPVAKKGDNRFPVLFTIDTNKRLCVTVRDNLTGKVLMRDHPLVKLK